MDTMAQIITEADKSNLDRAYKSCRKTYRAWQEQNRDMDKVLFEEARNNLDKLREHPGWGDAIVY